MLYSETVNLYYEDHGNGEVPLVLVHGWGMSTKVWAPVVEILSSSRQVIAIDLRGHGSSSRTDTYALSELANDLNLVVQALDLKRLVVAGWSLGGQVALAAVPLLRERLAGLVLIGTSPKFTVAPGYPHGLPPSEARGMSVLVKRSSQRGMENFCRNMFTAEEASQLERNGMLPLVECLGATTDERVLLPVLDTLVQTDLRMEVAAVDLPALLIHGSNDRICLAGASEWMAEQLPKGELCLMDGVGHAPFITRPADFTSVLDRFLARFNEQG